MLSKSSIQFSVDGRGCVPSLLLDLSQTMMEVVKIMATSSKGPLHTLPHTVPPTQQQATSDPHLCQRLLDTHSLVWVSLLWGHCSFLLGPGVHKVLFVPSKSLFPQSCVSSAGSTATSSKRAYAIPLQVCCTQSPCPCSRPLLTCTFIGATQTHKGRSGSVSVGSPGVHKALFEPSKYFWQV